MGRVIGRRAAVTGWLWLQADPRSTGSKRRILPSLKAPAIALAGLAAVAALLLALFAMGTLSDSDDVAAASVHLKGGKKAEPAFMDQGLTLNASGELAGLGNADVLVTISAVANPTAVCINPSSNDGKDQQPPGQNPAPVTVTGSVSIPKEEIKNGNTPFNVTTLAPATPIPGAPDCPNPKWSEVITDMAFTSATITVEQPPGTVVLTVFCTFSSPTSNGPVPAGRVSCS